MRCGRGLGVLDDLDRGEPDVVHLQQALQQIEGDVPGAVGRTQGVSAACTCTSAVRKVPSPSMPISRCSRSWKL